MSNLFRYFLPAALGMLLACSESETSKQAAGEQTEARSSNLEYVKSIRKIDVHMHIGSDQPFLIDFMDKWNFKFCTICTFTPRNNNLQVQIDTAIKILNKYPRYYAWITTFDPAGFEEEGWADKVIAQLERDFDNGAVGVKVWKAIGMEHKKSNGEYIQLDDPVFTPVFKFIANRNKTLIAHMGEPIHAWMPTYVTKDGIGRNYWAGHPEYSFWDKPELPSYSDILAARDHVLARHPNLRVVGAHLGSMEFDVDEIITRFETYPNFAVELGGRARYLMWQARGKVYDFFISYQDRIMYGTDRGSNRNMTPGQIKDAREGMVTRNEVFLRYFATSDEIPWGNIIYDDRPHPEPSYTVQGLNLPREVLDKFLYHNAVKWFPGIDDNYKR